MDVILQEDFSIALLMKKLKAAYFEVEAADDGDTSYFWVTLDSWHCSVRENKTQSSIMLMCSISLSKQEDSAIYHKLLKAVNDANSRLVNVCSWILSREDGTVSLIIEQHISYHTALIMPQLANLLHRFGGICGAVAGEYISPVLDHVEDIAH